MTAWVYRTQLDSNGIVTVWAHAGVVLAIDFDGNVHKSTDGGVTWSTISTVPAPAIGSFGNLIHDGSKWIWAAGGDITYSSTDGITWTGATTGLSPSNGSICYNGSGIYVVCSATANDPPTVLNVARSVDGVTWTNAHALHAPGSGPSAIIWDGSQFVIVNCIGGGPGSNTDWISTSPDGITWTETSSGSITDIGFLGAAYDRPTYVAQSFNGTIRVATTLLGLFSVSDVTIPGLGSDGGGLEFLDTSFVLQDASGNVATSPDASTWTVVSLNYPGADFTPQVIEDSVNGKWIAFGANNGYLSTLDVGSPLPTVPNVVGDSLPAAVSTIIGATFTVGSITIESSAMVAVDTIISQNPVGGSSEPAATPVDLVVSTGPASVIDKLTQKLLLYLHRVFDKDPHRQLAFRIRYDGTGLTWSILNGVMTLTATGGTGTSHTFNIAHFEIGQLAQFIAALPGYSVPYQDTSAYALLSALALLDSSGDINTSNGDHVYGYTNLLWSYLDANSSELAAARDQIPNALAQMTVPNAQDEWLDFHGSFYNVPRNQDELDNTYAPRMIARVLQPRGNNVAMAVGIQTSSPGAQTVRVIDAIDNTSIAITYNGLIHFDGSEFYDAGLGPGGAYGFFDVDFSFDFAGDVTQDTYYAQILQTVADFRDAGTQLRAVIFRNNGSTSTIVSDSFVGRVRVIVYDDFSGNSYRLLENNLVRLLEDGTARILES